MDSRHRLTAMKRIEIVVGGEHVPTVRALLAEHVTGYTVIPHVSGMGHHGYHEGRLLFNDVASLVMVLTVVPPEQLDVILDGLLPLLEGRSGVAIVSDAWVERPAYFTPG